MSASEVQFSSEQAGEVSGEQPTLIPPGEYTLGLVGWRTAIMWGRSHKLVLHFKVVGFGDCFGAAVNRYYNIKRVIGTPGPGGRFKATWNQDVVREYARIVGAPGRLDRLDLCKLSKLLIVGRVDTVCVTARQRSIPDCLKYSVVRELLRTGA